MHEPICFAAESPSLQGVESAKNQRAEDPRNLGSVLKRNILSEAAAWLKIMSEYMTSRIGLNVEKQIVFWIRYFSKNVLVLC